MTPHADPCLICAVYPPHGTLEKWAHSFYTVTGYIFYDKKNRWPDNHWIRTSEVVNFDPETGHVRTLYSNYILGTPNLTPENNV